MKNLNLYLILAFATLVTACTSNKELSSLDEYDDIYYTGSPALVASGPSVSSNSNLDGASDAERSYYDDVPYTETESEVEIAEDDDYYDEDYASRINNFHRYNQGDYIYSTSPNMSLNMMYGVGSYGSGFGMGFSYGTPRYGWGGYGYPYYDPFYSWRPYYSSPWYRPYPYYGYYDPFYPYYGYGYGYGYGGYYGGGYYGGGYYGGAYPPYYGGGDYIGSGGGIISTPRQSSSSVRPSRGGIINQSTDTDGRKSNSSESKVNSEVKSREGSGRAENVELRGAGVRNTEAVSREVSREATREVSRESYTRDVSTEYTRPGTTRSDFSPANQIPRERNTVTPGYSPSQPIQRNTVTPAQRSRSSVAPSFQRERSNVAPQTRPTRSTPSYNRGSNRSSSPSYSTPSRSSSPSYSPSRGTNNSSSPSSTPSRGNRR